MARSAHLRLAAVDGKRVRGVRKPKNGSLPVRFLDTADRVVRRIERAEEALKLIYKLPGGTDPIVSQALTREALAAIIDAGGSAKWLELMLCEHPIEHAK
jgi:hypothetical protein